MKKYVAVIVVTILAIGSFILLSSFCGRKNDKSNEAMEQAILCLLTVKTYDAVGDYYGEARSYMNPALLSLQEVSGYPNRFA